MGEIGFDIRARDKASAVLGHVSKKLGLFNKQGIGMGIAFAGATMALGAVTGAISGLFSYLGEATAKARDFSKSIAEVNTMLNETTNKYLPDMREAILDLSEASGKSATDLSRGMYQILSASIDAGKAIEFLGTATKASIAGLTEVETSVDALTTIINAYGMSAEEATRVSDIMFTAVVRGKLTFEEMAGSLGYIVPIASQANIAFEEVAAAVATLTRQGIRSRKAMTGLRSLFATLLSPAEDAANAAKKYGIILNDLALEVLGLQGIMQSMNDATDGTIGKMLELIPNIRALNAGLGLVGAGAKGFIFDLEAMESAMGATARAYADMTDNIYHRYQKLQAELERQKIEIGSDPAFQEAQIRWERFIADLQKAVIVDIPKNIFRDITKPEKGDFSGVIWGSDRYYELVAAQEAAALAAEELADSTDIVDISLVNTADGITQFIGTMNHWASEIDRTSILIKRLEYEISSLDETIPKLQTQFENFTELKEYESDLHYVSLATEDLIYINKIMDSNLKNLVTSIYDEEQAMKALEEQNKAYSKTLMSTSIKSMELQLEQLKRRGRETRKMKKERKKIQIEELETRIDMAKNQEKVGDGSLDTLREQLDAELRERNNWIWEYRRTLDTTEQELKNSLDYQEYLRDTYINDYLPKAKEQHMNALREYLDGLLELQNDWSQEFVDTWEETAGGIEEAVARILAAMAKIGGGTTSDFVGPWTHEHPLPSHQYGGIVEGRRGEPVPIIAHGGERFLGTQGRGGGVSNVNIAPIVMDVTVRNYSNIMNIAQQLAQLTSAKIVKGIRVSMR